jgi:hypothetical protein
MWSGVPRSMTAMWLAYATAQYIQSTADTGFSMSRGFS